MADRDLSYVAALTSLDQIEGVLMAVDCGARSRFGAREAAALEAQLRSVGGDRAAQLIIDLRKRAA